MMNFKNDITDLGTCDTVGALQDKLNLFPFGADFGFRNQPVQRLYYDKKNVSVYFQFDNADAKDYYDYLTLFQITHGNWSDQTFGQRSPIGPLKHLIKEVEEVIENPKDIVEFADCQLLLMDALRLSGFTMNQLYFAMLDKFNVNKARKWGEPDQNGTVEHIRDNNDVKP